MYIVEEKKTEQKGSNPRVRKEFENLRDADNYADNELDGFRITDSISGKIIREQEPSEYNEDDELDMMFPNEDE